MVALGVVSDPHPSPTIWIRYLGLKFYRLAPKHRPDIRLDDGKGPLPHYFDDRTAHDLSRRQSEERRAGGIDELVPEVAPAPGQHKRRSVDNAPDLGFGSEKIVDARVGLIIIRAGSGSRLPRRAVRVVPADTGSCLWSYLFCYTLRRH